MDEVISFTKDRFDNKQTGEPCDIFLVGYSMGGNYSLHYMGNSAKQNSKAHYPK